MVKMMIIRRHRLRTLCPSVFVLVEQTERAQTISLFKELQPNARLHWPCQLEGVITAVSGRRIAAPALAEN